MELPLTVSPLNREGAQEVAPAERSAGAPFADLHRTVEHTLTPRESAGVDARQDELMESTSVDGRPPSHRQRMTGWRWMAIGLPVLALSAAAWAMIRGASVGAIMGFGIGALLIVLLGGWPVWVAGLYRGKEETAARREAVAELHREDGHR